MGIIIRKYMHNDDVQLKRLLELSSEEESLLHIVKKSNDTFAYSAMKENKLVGAIIGWKSSFHPTCTYFRIVSDPFYVADDIEEKLLIHVEKTTQDALPLKTSIWETAVNLKELYAEKGFKEIRRTYMPTLQLSKIDLKLKYTEKYPIKTLAEISFNDELMKKLSLLVKNNYEAAHQVDRVIDLALEEWKKLILSEDTIMEGSYVFLDFNEEEILAYSFLHESDTGDVYELGWCGCSNQNDKRLIPKLVFQQIKYAHQQNVSSIVGEFDTTDDFAMEVFQSFPFSPCPTWITYVKKS